MMEMNITTKILLQKESRKSGLTACSRISSCWVLGTLILFMASAPVNAQDIIRKKDKTEIQANVMEITDDAVKYKLFDFQEGPVYNIKKGDITSITYQNGRTESYASEEKQTVNLKDKINGIAPAPKNRKDAQAGENAGAAEPPSGISKNPGRIILGPGIHRTRGQYQDFHDPHIAALFAYERMGVFSDTDNAGIGVALNNLFGLHFQEVKGYSRPYDVQKHYLSTYLFKEFDTQRFNFGLSGGPGLNLTKAAHFDPNGTEIGHLFKSDASFLTAGVHTGQYVQKYISKNRRGEKNIFIRFGFNQYIMLKGSFGGVANFSVGF